MRTLTAAATYVFPVIAIIAVGATALGDARELTVRQDRELDSAIDRIVAEGKAKREARIASYARPTESGAKRAPPKQVPPAIIATENVADQGASETTGSAVRELAFAPGLTPEVAERRPTVLARKGAKRGRSQGRTHFLPLQLSMLPKFTVYSLLGLR